MDQIQRSWRKNCFLLEFQNNSSKKRVTLGRPQSFEKYLACHLKFEGHTPPKDIVFIIELFWNLFHIMPLARMTKDVGEQLGLMTGRVKMVDTNGKGYG